MRGRIIHLNIRLIQINLITIWLDLLLVIAVNDYRKQIRLVSLVSAHIKGRAFPMVGDDDRQSIQPVARKVGPLRINTQHAVRQMHRRESRHQQMTDISHIRIHIVDRILNHIEALA